MKKTIVLGMSGGVNVLDWNVCNKITPFNYHDSSACLVVDGQIVAAIEEERLTRIKHTSFFPLNAIRYCIESNNLSISEIDFFTLSISEDFLDKILVKLGYKLKGRKFLSLLLSDMFDHEIDSSKLIFFDHHYAHASSAYFHSGFEKSLVVTLDGQGDGISGSIYSAESENLTLQRTIEWNNSLGNFYTYFTKFLGFNFFDEYKIMGLASYGNPNKYDKVFRNFYELLPNGEFIIRKENYDTLENICPPRKPYDRIDEIHNDIAASLQKSLEQIVLHVVQFFQKSTGLEYLSFAGGVALNSKLAGVLLYSNLFKDIFVHPASADNGLSIGTALAKHYSATIKWVTPPKLTNTYWGTNCQSSTKIEHILAPWKEYIHFEKRDDISKKTAELLAKGEIVGWVQGRSEFGPRALGNRSILADPRPIENKQKVNLIIKLREGFRPFAPSVLAECVDEYFEIPKNNKKDYPFMSFVLKVKSSYKDLLCAITHVDGTARVQTVNKSSNPKFWNLINHFGKMTNIPMVLNTSFNNHIEPIVNHEEDALNCFLTNKLDSLVIGDYLIIKKKDILSFGKTFQIHFFKHIIKEEHEGKVYLRDLYWKQNIEISKEIAKFLDDKLINFNNISEKLRKELFKLWVERAIFLIPSES